ncbi:hypothetical protein J3U99_18205 [Brucella pituitosa]|uniref:hypothetical protein n=1 Tax=Brucella pituitosa TaxID=571256 RepID=UPI002003F2AD|nr:hypothetical protein [Brucella pituitosa]MCK4206713.1 hypothetical protein [Brucella pituitosa]
MKKLSVALPRTLVSRAADLTRSVSPGALIRSARPVAALAVWSVASIFVLAANVPALSQNGSVLAANTESSGGAGGTSSNGTNGVAGTAGADGVGGAGGDGGDGGAGAGTPNGAGTGGTAGGLGASTVDPSSTTAVSGTDGGDGADGTLAQNQSAGGGGGGGGGGTGVFSTDTVLESKTTISGGGGGNGDVVSLPGLQRIQAVVLPVAVVMVVQVSIMGVLQLPKILAQFREAVAEMVATAQAG